ncbi:MAG: DUF3137 domain-containing protein, partial [Gammaproteobacteria bacterium]
MKSPAEFQRMYNSRLLPVLQSLEPYRKDTLGAFLLALALLLASLPGFLAFFRSGKTSGLVIALILLAIGIYRFVVYGQKKKAYAVEFKELVIREMVHLIDPNLTYRPHQCIRADEYRESDLFRNPLDRYTGDDLAEGILGMTQCRFSELWHQEKKESVDSKGRRR